MTGRTDDEVRRRWGGVIFRAHRKTCSRPNSRGQPPRDLWWLAASTSVPPPYRRTTVPCISINARVNCPKRTCRRTDRAGIASKPDNGRLLNRCQTLMEAPKSYSSEDDKRPELFLRSRFVLIIIIVVVVGKPPGLNCRQNYAADFTSFPPLETYILRTVLQNRILRRDPATRGRENYIKVGSSEKSDTRAVRKRNHRRGVPTTSLYFIF